MSVSQTIETLTKPIPVTSATHHLMLTAAPLRSVGAFRSPVASRSSVRTMATAKLEMWVKGDPTTSTLGDCTLYERITLHPARTLLHAGPFCHRVLLSAEEKEVPYTKGYIDFAAKPDWLLEVNPSGTVPVAKDLETGEWIVDSGVIADHLEAKYPQHPLGQTSDVYAGDVHLFALITRCTGRASSSLPLLGFSKRVALTSRKRRLPWLQN